MAEPSPLLDDALAQRVLREAGLVGAEDDVRCVPLGGGVSSIVLLARTPRGRFVLKQPRERFRVADEWIVDPRRVAVEVAFVRAFAPRLPAGAVMPVRAFREDVLVAVFDAAPEGWTSWKERLLAGSVEPALAEWAGRTLARIHDVGETEFADRFDHPDLFDQQRLDPYYRTSALRVPEAEAALGRLIHLCRSRRDFVHGDYSPKNFLTDGSSIAAIDHEVAARGDCAFDVAFLLNHLLLKAVHVADKRDALLDAAGRAWVAYADAREAEDPGRGGRVVAHLGGLQLARARGKSPAEYLTPPERRVVGAFGVSLLRDPPADVGAVLERVPRTPPAS